MSLTSISTATAQMEVELTPFAGYYIASDLWSNSGAQVSLSDSFMWGGRLTLNPSRMYGVEFAYTRTGSDAVLDRLQAGQPRSNIGRLDIDNFDFNFLAYQNTANPHIRPFFLFGFGWASTHPKIDPDFVLPSGVQPQGHTQFNFNFSLGTRIEMSDRAALRLEGRWRVTDTNVTTDAGLWCDPWGYCYNYSSSWYDSGELIAGLSIRLK